MYQQARRPVKTHYITAQQLANLQAALQQQAASERGQPQSERLVTLVPRPRPSYKELYPVSSRLTQQPQTQYIQEAQVEAQPQRIQQQPKQYIQLLQQPVHQQQLLRSQQIQQSPELQQTHQPQQSQVQYASSSIVDETSGTFEEELAQLVAANRAQERASYLRKTQQLISVPQPSASPAPQQYLKEITKVTPRPAYKQARPVALLRPQTHYEPAHLQQTTQSPPLYRYVYQQEPQQQVQQAQVQHAQVQPTQVQHQVQPQPQPQR